MLMFYTYLNFILGLDLILILFLQHSTIIVHLLKIILMAKFLYLFAVSLLIASCQDSKNNSQYSTEGLSPEETVAMKIAQANGIENWDDVEELKFTFNVKRAESAMARSWSWKPHNQEITMTNPTDSVTYNRTTMDSLAITTDKGFINDSYWLLAPYHLVWDSGTTLKIQDTATAPISQKMMSKITLTYGDEGGYTPGDAYDFYYDDDFMVREWVFRKANGQEPSMITTWEDYEDYKGLKIAKNHNTQGDVKLYFSDIEVTME